MHAQSKDIFAHFKECRAYETASEFKKEGKIRHFGISFHDTADMPEEIPSEFPIVKKGEKLGMSFFTPLTTLVQAAKKLPFYRRRKSEKLRHRNKAYRDRARNTGFPTGIVVLPENQ